jgi:hypothetical protein
MDGESLMLKFYKTTKAIKIDPGVKLALTQEQIKANSRCLRYLEPQEMGEDEQKVLTLDCPLSGMLVLDKPGRTFLLDVGQVFGLIDAEPAKDADGFEPAENPLAAAAAAKIKELESQLAALKGKK